MPGGPNVSNEKQVEGQNQQVEGLEQQAKLKEEQLKKEAERKEAELKKEAERKEAALEKERQEQEVQRIEKEKQRLFKEQQERDFASVIKAKQLKEESANKAPAQKDQHHADHPESVAAVVAAVSSVFPGASSSFLSSSSSSLSTVHSASSSTTSSASASVSAPSCPLRPSVNLQWSTKDLLEAINAFTQKDKRICDKAIATLESHLYNSVQDLYRNQEWALLYKEIPAFFIGEIKATLYPAK